MIERIIELLKDENQPWSQEGRVLSLDLKGHKIEINLGNYDLHLDSQWVDLSFWQQTKLCWSANKVVRKIRQEKERLRLEKIRAREQKVNSTVDQFFDRVAGKEA